MPDDVVGYIRVSSEEQRDSGVSLTAQPARIEAWCQANGKALRAIESDPGVSASSLDRPGLQRALAALRDGQASGLVVTTLDRLTRSLRDWIALQEEFFNPRATRPATLLGVSETLDTRTAGGRLVLNLRMSVAQWELEVNTERTCAALDHKRIRNECVGTVPRGLRIGAGGMIEPDPVEGLQIERIRQLAAEGLGPRAIARSMADLQGGRPWPESTIRTLLKKDRAPQ